MFCSKSSHDYVNQNAFQKILRKIDNSSAKKKIVGESFFLLKTNKNVCKKNFIKIGAIIYKNDVEGVQTI